jgi:hypothetical protein
VTYLTPFISDIIPPHLWDYDEEFDAVKVTQKELHDIFKPPPATNTVEAYVQSWHVKQESIKRLEFDFPTTLVSTFVSYDTNSFIELHPSYNLGRAYNRLTI